MNFQEANVLLTEIALGDNRSTHDTIVKYWRDLLFDISLRDAREAVTIHRRESTQWLQPAHIRAIVKHNRNLRGAAANVIYEPNADDTFEIERRKRAALIRRAADGQIGPQPVSLALTGAPIAAEVPDLVAAKTEAFRAARRPLDVRCPYCHATAGNPCRVGRGSRAGFIHPARTAARAAAQTTARIDDQGAP